MADFLVLREILKCYEQASSQQISFDKSSIAFSRNVPHWLQDEIAGYLGVARVDKHEKYLCLLMEVSYSKIDAFQAIKEKIHKKLQGGRERTLTAAGKEVLLKSVIQSIPTYFMNCFEMPKQLCHDIHQLMAKFWWGATCKNKKIHWKAWDKLCSPKFEGGLGFRNLYHFNLYLVAKEGWWLLKYLDSLLARCLKAKYYPSSPFMSAIPKGGQSFSWKSILAGKSVLEQGICYQVVNGSSISIWYDSWIPLPHLFKPFSPVMEGIENMLVEDLIDSEERCWMLLLLQELFMEEEVKCIACIPLNICPSEDCIIWHFERNGLFTVKSAYYQSRGALQCNNLSFDGR